MSNPFSKLTADEINTLIEAATPALTALANGDGSTTSLVGQAIALQGQLIANASVMQKVAVNDLAAGALAFLESLKPKA